MRVSIEDIEKSFGCYSKDFSVELKNKINKTNLNYSIYEKEELNKLYIKILKKILEDKQIVGDVSRTEVWNKGWQENLNAYKLNPNDPNTLIPRFIRPGEPIRFFGNYIKPENNLFELDYFSIYRQWLFEKFLKDFENIYEFGCGTGFNLIEAARIFPEKNLYGSDFVQSSVDLVNLISKNMSLKIKSEKFDLINPNYNYDIKSNSLILTFGSIEQISSKFHNFVDFILKKSPSLIIHTEPILELYDCNLLNDYLAYTFQKKRNYTYGFLPYLENLSNKNIIDLIKIKRLHFGSTMMEGFNLIIWKPK